MDKTITLTLVKALIIEAVKNETFLTGQVEKAAEEKLIAHAYHEQAGDETYQERLLERALYTNLGDLLSHLSDYISPDSSATGDNNYYAESGGSIVLYIVVSQRFNNAYTDSLAKLCSKYIEESMLMDWWKPVNEKQSALYAQFVERDLQAIKRCFNKTAPTAPTVPYTQSLSVTGSTVELEVGELHNITYTLSDNAIDDIEIRIEDSHIVNAGRDEHGFLLVGKAIGHTYVELYSKHNESVSQVIQVYVTNHA